MPRAPAPRNIVPPLEVIPIFQLRDFNPTLRQIHQNITVDDGACLSSLARMGLIANSRTCDNRRCRNNQMGLISRPITDLKRWRCNLCQKEKSIRAGSFFSNSHLNLQDLFELIYYWSRGTSQENVLHELSIGSEHTTVDWFNFIRDVCVMYIEDYMEPIGGLNDDFSGKIVEIDESLFMQRKYHRGGHDEKRWVLAGIERHDPGNVFFVDLGPNDGQPRRDAATLLPLIEQWVEPGTQIITDGWAAYNGIPNLLGGGAYMHQVVIHQDNFVDPNNPLIHTQTIEGTWAGMKNKMRVMHGTSNVLHESYLAEFVFRRKFANIFGELLFWIRAYYHV